MTGRTRHRCRRALPVPGEVLVAAGSTVKAQEIVARTLMPGDVTPINLANALSLPPGDVPSCMLKKEGERIEFGEALARTKGLFGLFKAEYASKTAGTIESISHVTGQVIVRGEPLKVELRAYLAGKVVEVLPREGVVIEADVSLVQGILGIGGEAFGPIRMACPNPTLELTADLVLPEMRGAVVVGGARMTAEAMKKAVAVGAAAVVSGGIDDADLRDFLGYDLGVAITGSEDMGVTLIITEGFGDIAMAERTFELFRTLEGAEAAANGATQIRAGVMRPEVVVPLRQSREARTASLPGTAGPAMLPDHAGPAVSPGQLALGTPVRIIRDPYFGLIGTVAALPPEPQVLASGSKARVLEVQFADGAKVAVPRANVELIEG